MALIALMLGLSHTLGQKRRDPATHEPYESGIVSVGDAHIRISVGYYLVAILFVIFDLEAVYLFTWAIAVREAGLPGLIEATIFIGILLAGLIYLWRLGALDWGPEIHPRDTAKKK
nr:NADH-quinone oxidoreductase subunit A [uncultured Microbulbifer sp.]